MRIVCTVHPALGHLFAMVPLAWALHLEGHQVIMAAPRSLAAQIHRAGLTAAVVGGDATFAGCRPRDRELAGDPGLDLDVNVALAEHTAPDLIALVRDWQPDLIITEPAEHAAPLTATRAGIPWVLHDWGLPVAGHSQPSAADGQPVAGRGPRAAADDLQPVADGQPVAGRGPRAELDGIAERLARLGPAPKPPLATIATCPPSLRPEPGPGSVLAMRYVPYNAAGTAPGWLLAPPQRPRVCVSMGTVAIPAGVDGLTAALAGLSDLDVEVVVSGAGVHDVTDLPANARRIGWIPHHQVLPGCDLFVHHSGVTSTMTALVAGRPHLVMPQMREQFAVADRLTRSGVARCVPFADRGAATVRAAALDLLGVPYYAARAARLRAEIAAMPGPGSVAAQLAERVRQHAAA